MLLREFSGARIMGWFLGHPTRKIHFKELCRELRLGPLTVKTYCEEFIGYGWLKEERSANLRIFFLNNEHFVARAIKRAYFLERLRSSGIGSLVGEVVSMALYGSHASGEYDERSDIDLLVVGRREQVNYGHVKTLEENLGKQVQLTVLPLERWEKNKQRDPFMLSVLRNYVLIRGVPL